MKSISFRKGVQVVLNNGNIATVERIIPNTMNYKVSIGNSIFKTEIQIASREVDFIRTKQLQLKNVQADFTLDKMESGFTCHFDTIPNVGEWSAMREKIVVYHSSGILSEYEVEENYTVVRIGKIMAIYDRDGDLVWQRNEKSEQQIKIEELQKTIDLAKKQIEELKGV